MRHFFIIALLALTISMISDAQAQQTARQPSGTRALPQHLEGYIQAQIKTDEAYLAMVDAAIRNPAKTDWTKLRQIYPDTSFYEAIGGKELAGLAKQMEALVIKENSPGGIYAFKTYLREHYASVGAHEAALRVANTLKTKDIDVARSNYALRSLINSIVRPVDGLTQQNAFRLISFEEMETVLRVYFKLSGLKEPQIKMFDKQPYALYDILDFSTKKSDTYYFFIDTRMMGHEGEKKLAKMVEADTPKSESEQDTAYINLVKAAATDPAKADWAALRIAYSESSHYHPYIGEELWDALTKAANEVRDTGDNKSKTRYAAIYQTHFGHYRAQQHVVQFHASHKLNFLKLDLAKTASQQLVQALMRTGDGRSPETAFKVIDVGEETMILQAINAQFRKRDVQQVNGIYLDIYDILNARGRNAAMYFNVDKLIKSKN
jgi:hypothetical protein